MQSQITHTAKVPSHLQHLDLFNHYLNHMQPEQINALFIGIAKMKQLIKLDLSCNFLGSAEEMQFKLVSIGIGCLPQLHTLLLNFNFLSSKNPEFLKMLMKCIARLPRLHTLDLSNNDLNRMEADELHDILSPLKESASLLTIKGVEHPIISRTVSVNICALITAIAQVFYHYNLSEQCVSAVFQHKPLPPKLNSMILPCFRTVSRIMNNHRPSQDPNTLELSGSNKIQT